MMASYTSLKLFNYPAFLNLSLRKITLNECMYFILHRAIYRLLNFIIGKQDIVSLQKFYDKFSTEIVKRIYHWK